MAVERTKDIAKNKKAFFDFEIEETYETGIELTGTEVKSIRQGKANLKDSYAMVENGELMLYNMHISPYEQGNRFNHDPLRKRRLLMHKKEIYRLFGYVREKGYSLIPLKLYFKGNRIKVELGLARGKKLFDKRETMKEKDHKMEMDKAFRARQKM
jgi:SsrA-binding protein